MTQQTSTDRQTYAPTPGNNSPTVNTHSTFGTAATTQNNGFNAFKPQSNTFFGNNQFGYTGQSGFNNVGASTLNGISGMMASINPNENQASECVHKSLIPAKNMLSS